MEQDQDVPLEEFRPSNNNNKSSIPKSQSNVTVISSIGDGAVSRRQSSGDLDMLFSIEKSSYYNADLAPVPPEKKIWTTRNYIALW